MNLNSNIILRTDNAGCSRVLRSGEPSRIDRISVACEERALTLLWGAEGCGKNLLLRLLGLLEAPDAGEVYFRGGPTRELSGEARAALRNRHFGFVFSEPFLLPSFLVVENIAMPLLKISSSSTGEARERTQAMLDFVGLHAAGEYGVDQLSLYEQHKVALARALVNQPEVLIVENIDTGLHGEDLAQFGGLLQRANTELGATVIVTASDKTAVPAAHHAEHIATGVPERSPEPAHGEGTGT